MLSEEKQKALEKATVLESTKYIQEISASLGRSLESLAMVKNMIDLPTMKMISPLKDLQKMVGGITPSLKLMSQMAEMYSGTAKSFEYVFSNTALFQAELNAISSLAKINWSAFQIPELIQQRREWVHEELKKELGKNKVYYAMWDGSWKALESDNPDKIRQSALSMRELFRTIIHDLSDEQAIMKKFSLKENKEITRKYRLLFILENKGTIPEIENIDYIARRAVEINKSIEKATHEGGEEEKIRNLLFLYEGFLRVLIEPNEKSSNS